MRPSGIRLPDFSKLAINLKNDNDIIIFRHDVIVNFFDGVLFLLSSLDTGPSFMSILSLVLESRRFSFIRDWPEIRKNFVTVMSYLSCVMGFWFPVVFSITILSSILCESIFTVNLFLLLKHNFNFLFTFFFFFFFSTVELLIFSEQLI